MNYSTERTTNRQQRIRASGGDVVILRFVPRINITAVDSFIARNPRQLLYANRCGALKNKHKRTNEKFRYKNI